MNTADGLERYKLDVEKWWKAERNNDPFNARPEPEPKHYGLTTGMDLWAAGKIKKEITRKK